MALPAWSSCCYVESLRLGVSIASSAVERRRAPSGAVRRRPVALETSVLRLRSATPVDHVPPVYHSR